jgi:large subunit ribosomal protein L3
MTEEKTDEKKKEEETVNTAAEEVKNTTEVENTVETENKAEAEKITVTPQTPYALLGRKVGMTQVWNDKNEFVPVSVIEVGTNVVSQIKTVENDGYNAVQLAFGNIKPKKVSRGLQGHFKKAGITPRKYTREIRVDSVENLSVGQELKAGILDSEKKVNVFGTTKGKGFAGGMKRHGFHGVRATHGSHKNQRKIGAIGQSATPAKVYKGKKMPGRMGGVHDVTQNLKIYKTDSEKGIVLVKGAIPGPKNSIVLVKGL